MDIQRMATLANLKNKQINQNKPQTHTNKTPQTKQNPIKQTTTKDQTRSNLWELNQNRNHTAADLNY